jgi:hypothetical protein
MPTLMSDAALLVVLSSLPPALPLSLPLSLSSPHAVAPRARIPTVRTDANFLLRRKTPP